MAITTETEDNRPEVTAFAFGRVWFGGTNSQRWGTTLFFSQVLTDINRAGKCHQEADPTAESINSLIDSDGGTVRISEMGSVVGMVALSTALVVLCNNGVWTIRGGSQGFTPLSFVVERVTKIGCIAKRSIIEVEDTVMYVAVDGIYQIGNQAGQDQYQGGGKSIVSTNITEPKINSFYNDIEHSELTGSVSVYDNKQKVYSLYYGPVNDLNKALNLRLKSGAWYPYTFDTDSEELPARFRMAFPFFSQESRNVVGTKFLMFSDDDVDQRYSINEYNDANFKDFGTAEIDAYFEFSPLTLDNPQFDKSAMYVTNYFEFTEQTITGVDDAGKPTYTYPSSALLTPKWEWHSVPGVGSKVGRQRQVYRFREVLAEDDGTINTGMTVVTSRDKVRGHGKALGLRYDAESGKDMRLIGVTLPMTMDGQY